MVGGGKDAFIGAVHRLAARMDDRYELVAGALSADPERARASAAQPSFWRDPGSTPMPTPMPVLLTQMWLAAR